MQKIACILCLLHITWHSLLFLNDAFAPPTLGNYRVVLMTHPLQKLQLAVNLDLPQQAHERFLCAVQLLERGDVVKEEAKTPKYVLTIVVGPGFLK